MLSNPQRHDVFRWTLVGTIVVGLEQDGMRIAERNGFITKVVIACGGTGTSGSNVFDINKHVPAKPITTQRNATAGVSIYPIAANPAIAFDAANPNAVFEVALPDNLNFLKGDFFSLDVDTVAGGGGPNSPQDFTIKVFVQYD